jgi:hypothetical protein
VRAHIFQRPGTVGCGTQRSFVAYPRVSGKFSTASTWRSCASSWSSKLPSPWGAQRMCALGWNAIHAQSSGAALCLYTSLITANSVAPRTERSRQPAATNASPTSAASGPPPKAWERFVLISRVRGGRRGRVRQTRECSGKPPPPGRGPRSVYVSVRVPESKEQPSHYLEECGNDDGGSRRAHFQRSHRRLRADGRRKAWISRPEEYGRAPIVERVQQLEKDALRYCLAHRIVIV